MSQKGKVPNSLKYSRAIHTKEGGPKIRGNTQNLWENPNITPKCSPKKGFKLLRTKISDRGEVVRSFKPTWENNYPPTP